MKSKFIVIDGGDGAGKSTQIQKLKEYLGEKAFFSREPGGSPYAEMIRDVILDPMGSESGAKTQCALFWAGRSDHLDKTIIPALQNGKIVILDRFDSSTFAYQLYGKNGLDEVSVERFFEDRDFYLGDTKPDLYIYLDVDVETGLKRKQSQGDELNHFDTASLEFRKRMRQGFSDFFSNPRINTEVAIVDANLSEDEVFGKIMMIVGNTINS